MMTCFEYQRLQREDFTYPNDFEYLLTAALPCFRIVVQQGQLCLVVGHYLAKILLPSGVQLEILPKVVKQTVSGGKTERYSTQITSTRRWVKQMLLDIASSNLQTILPALQLSTVATIQNQDDDAKPWYDWLLTQAVKQLQAGEASLPSRYHTQTNNRPQARGKLNLKAQLKHNWHRPHYLYSEHDVFAEDKLIAQFLATGWRQLQQLYPKHIDGKIYHNHYQQVAYLSVEQWHSAYKTIKFQQASWKSQLTPTNYTALNSAITWCWWLLQDALFKPSTTHGCHNLPSSTVMINMNQAFEQWVVSRLTVWVEDNLPNSNVRIQPRIDWLRQLDSNNSDITHNEYGINKSAGGRTIQYLRPDACILKGDNEVSHVIDVKYKRINSVYDVSSSDWQQLYVYQQQLQAEQAWLIYPMTANFKSAVAVHNHNFRYSQSNSIANLKVIPFDMHKRMIMNN